MLPAGEVLPGPAHEGEWLGDLVTSLRSLHLWFKEVATERQEEIRRAHAARWYVGHEYKVGEYVVVLKPLVDQEKSAKLVNRAVGVAEITAMAVDKKSVTVRYGGGRLEQRVATSRLILFPYERQDGGVVADESLELRGSPLSFSVIRDTAARGKLLVYGVAYPGGQEELGIGKVVSNEFTERMLRVEEFRPKGDGPFAGVAWRPVYVQSDGRVAFRSSETVLLTSVPYDRVYQVFRALMVSNRLPQPVVSRLLPENGIVLASA